MQFPPPPSLFYIQTRESPASPFTQGTRGIFFHPGELSEARSLPGNFIWGGNYGRISQYRFGDTPNAGHDRCSESECRPTPEVVGGRMPGSKITPLSVSRDSCAPKGREVVVLVPRTASCRPRSGSNPQGKGPPVTDCPECYTQASRRIYSGVRWVQERNRIRHSPHQP